MLDSVPWFIGGEAEHSPEVARLLAHAATGGESGIVSARDMIVSAQDIPTTTVRVGPGSAVLGNKYESESQQAYLARNVGSTDVAIPATGSDGGRTFIVILRVTDPDYDGQMPADPINGPFVKFDVIQDGGAVNFPHIRLARVAMPASTATVMQSYITDLRELADPKSRTKVIPRPSLGSAGLTLTSTSAYPTGEYFPDAGVMSMAIPTWATRMQIRAEWLSAYIAAKGGYGSIWVSYGPDGGAVKPTYNTQAFSWDADEIGAQSRVSWVVHDEVPVPAAWRGTTQPFYFKANKQSSATAYPGKVGMDAGSGIVLSVNFLESVEK